MVDLMLYETGDGGDLQLNGGNLSITTGVENEPYISMYGGADWWGNNLLIPTQPFLATTEKVLREVALNSSGRIRVQQAVDADLLPLKNSIAGTTITTTVTITNDNRLSIYIDIDGQSFYYLWNPDTLFLTYKV